MAFKSLGMVQMQVQNWNEAIKWYEDNLSLTVQAREDDHKFCILTFPEGSCSIALYGGEAVTAGTRNRCIPAILVDNLIDTIEELRSRKIKIEREFTGGEEGYRLAVISDCEGNLIHLYDWYTPKN